MAACLISGRLAVGQEQPVSVALDARERLFEQLATDAEHFDARNILKKVVRVSKPSVVHIQSRKIVQTGSRRTIEEAGSGFVIEVNQQKYILTNRHVVFPTVADGVKISLEDSRQLTVENIASDPASDIAVITVRETESLVPARVGDSGRMEIGDFVVAIGSPFGLTHSITYGIISAKGRKDLVLGTQGVVIQDFIQTDAAINPGNSGGPLVSMRGEVIGINTAIASSSGGNEGIGFTIPISMAMVVVGQLLDKETVRGAYLGVRMDHDFTDSTALKLGLSHARGVRITGVTESSPADKAKITPNDVILSFNGTLVENDDHLANLVSLTPVGNKASLLLLRNRKPIRVEVQLTSRPQSEEK